jgi:hypothetical protein
MYGNFVGNELFHQLYVGLFYDNLLLNYLYFLRDYWYFHLLEVNQRQRYLYALYLRGNYRDLNLHALYTGPQAGDKRLEFGYVGRINALRQFRTLLVTGVLGSSQDCVGLYFLARQTAHCAQEGVLTGYVQFIVNLEAVEKIVPALLAQQVHKRAFGSNFRHV